MISLRKRPPPGIDNQTGMAYVMAARGMRVYAGTVDPVTVQERREANRRARKSRRVNRKRAR